ncbi:MAG: hypothetical protein RLZZ22_638, partial [Pseudomonadota bacterium]
MKITVLGAGAWGTALAMAAADNGSEHAVRLWARDPGQVARMQTQRENARYLPGLPFPARLQVLDGPAEDLPRQVTDQDLVVVATPMAALRGLLCLLRDCAAPVVWLCKGFERGGVGLLGHEIRAEVAPGLQVGALSGPSFAQEVARGRPTALVAASDSA